MFCASKAPVSSEPSAKWAAQRSPSQLPSSRREKPIQCQASSDESSAENRATAGVGMEDCGAVTCVGAASLAGQAFGRCEIKVSPDTQTRPLVPPAGRMQHWHRRPGDHRLPKADYRSTAFGQHLLMRCEISPPTACGYPLAPMRSPNCFRQSMSSIELRTARFPRNRQAAVYASRRGWNASATGFKCKPLHLPYWLP